MGMNPVLPTIVDISSETRPLPKFSDILARTRQQDMLQHGCLRAKAAPMSSHSEWQPVNHPSREFDTVSDDMKGQKRRERWTQEEHERFLVGLMQYGRKWKKIQGLIQSKTAVQIRTHAYGYFAKLLRNLPEEEEIWELAPEATSLPRLATKPLQHNKRRYEPKTDAIGMEILRRFVLKKPKESEKDHYTLPEDTEDDSASETNETVQQLTLQPCHHVSWSMVDVVASSMLQLQHEKV